MSLIQPLVTLVNQIPHGRVLSYGRLAEQLNTVRRINEQEKNSGKNPSDGWKIDQSKGTKNQSSSIMTDETTSGWSVGRLLSSLPEKDWAQLPWQRVINKQGYISTLKLGRKGLEQIKLLREEGVEVNSDGYVDMVKYEWNFPREDLFNLNN